ncbi:MAG TPA: type II toxin-antitoxin system prevent-host-death family antitoxin [Caulobacteraceae bacterium]|jgi:prevent-host-death family protein
MTGPTLTVAAAEANRGFSRLLRAARNGARITITSHGEPVAELGPVERPNLEAIEQQRWREAQERLEARWAKTRPIVVGPWTRDELYERD